MQKPDLSPADAPVLGSGFCALFSADTREFKLPGLKKSLFARRICIKDLAEREEYIITKRTNISGVLEAFEHGLQKKEFSSEVKNMIVAAMTTAVRDILIRPRFALIQEELEFQESTEGTAFLLWQCTREGTDWITSVEDAKLFIKVATEEDLGVIEELSNWCTQASDLKN